MPQKPAAPRPIGASTTHTPLRLARNAMVASANPAATRIGVEILRAGGNAVDAAVAMGVALSVMEPHRSHVGGDVFLQYWDAGTRKAWALNGSGAAPSRASVEQVAGGIPERGIRAACVPGAPDAWITAVERWGKMTLPEVLAPAIEIAETGYPLPKWQMEHIRRHEELWQQFPESGAVLVPERFRQGGCIYQPVLGRTLREIASGGRDAFYKGSFADKLLEYSDAEGGFFARVDLEYHQSEIADPIETTYHGVRVTEQPPVSQGHLLLQMLNIIEGFDFSGREPESAAVIHTMAEAKKLAFADRMAYMGDTPDSPLESLLSKRYATKQRRRIDSEKAQARYTPGKLENPNTGTDTTSLVVIDAQGNAVSLIQSLFHHYGSGVVVPGTGVLLNNRMTGFSLTPDHPNVLEPGKRPMHTLNTWMLFHGDDLWAIGGTPGADVQVQTNLQVISQIVDFGRDPQEAIESPKWSVPPDGAELIVEDRLDLDRCYELRQMGHRMTIEGPWSAPCASQVIMVDPHTGTLMGASDPRSEGLALGY